MYTLVGVDGNSFSIMGYVRRAMKRCGKTKEEIDKYINRAMSSDYQNLLTVSEDMCMELNELNEEGI